MPTTGTEEQLWPRLERYLKAGSLIPVLGPGCVTFGKEDQPLYPWLAERLVEKLHIELPPELPRPLDLHAVAGAHLATHGAIEDLCIELDTLLESTELTPGPLLCDLARIGAFNHYFTLAFDPLLERALSRVRYGGVRTPDVWEFSLGQSPVDLPFGIKNPPHALLGYLFGRISPNPSFHLWDHDAIEFVLALQRTLPSLNTLAATLAGSHNNLLFLGSDFSDWLTRFFLRVIKNKPLNEDRRLAFMLAESNLRRDTDAVLFYDALGGSIQIVHDSPIHFLRDFTARALRGFALADKPAAPPAPPVDRQMPPGAIFISYCHADREFACRVAEKLQRHGCLIWMDRERLQGGENFENSLENAVKQCGLFLSLITPETERRVESYFHRERHWAAQRAEKFAPNEPFYFPLATEDAPRPRLREPAEFAQIHVEIALGGEIPDALCERLRTIQQSRFPAP